MFTCPNDFPWWRTKTGTIKENSFNSCNLLLVNVSRFGRYDSPSPHDDSLQMRYFLENISSSMTA